jgi:hypothetical protein
MFRNAHSYRHICYRRYFKKWVGKHINVQSRLVVIRGLQKFRNPFFYLPCWPVRRGGDNDFFSNEKSERDESVAEEFSASHVVASPKIQTYRLMTRIYFYLL